MTKKIKDTNSTAKKKQAVADTSNVIPFPQKKAMPPGKDMPQHAETPPVAAIPPDEETDDAVSDIFGGGKRTGGKRPDDKQIAMDEAQDVMYEAWDATTSKRAVTLAKKALKISPDCADAYVLLAQETAQSPEEEITLYRQGVEAGERALGKEIFKNAVGFFWEIFETRPYMRARAGLAECLWDAGRREEAVGHYQDMLRLNRGDNQGNRYVLMPHLIQMWLDEKAAELFANYSDDASAFWSYSKALLDFRKHGVSPAAGKSLRAAIKGNKHVPAYLTGRKKFPRTLPDHYGFGDDNEAVIYVEDNMTAWEKTPGALEWLAENIKK